MCGRYALVVVGDGSLQRRFSLEELLDDPTPRYNVAPTQQLPVVVRHSPNHLETGRWGLIPSWAKDPSIGNRMINARAETFAEKPAFRSALRRRRSATLGNGNFRHCNTLPLRASCAPMSTDTRALTHTMTIRVRYPEVDAM